MINFSKKNTIKKNAKQNHQKLITNALKNNLPKEQLILLDFEDKNKRNIQIDS